MAKIVIDEERCKGCELCTAACPKHIIVMSEHFNKKGYRPAKQINPEKCTGCAFCAIVVSFKYKIQDTQLEFLNTTIFLPC